MNMRSLIVTATLGAVLGAATAAPAFTQLIEQPGRMARMLPIRNVRQHDGFVTGEIVNATDGPVRDVELAIDYAWLWSRELRPGADDPSRVEYVTLAREIPPGGHSEFALIPTTDLPVRPDGYFV